MVILLIVLPFEVLRKRRAVLINTRKLLLYYCIELSFAGNLWGHYKDQLKACKTEPAKISMPLEATVKGIFFYPLARSYFFILLTMAVMGLIYFFCRIFSLISLNELYHEIPLALQMSIFCTPFIAYYVSSFCADVSQMTSNQGAIMEYLDYLGWAGLSELELQQTYKQVEIDFYLFKQHNDLGSILLFVGPGGLLIYSRITEVISDQALIVLLSLFAAIAISKIYYEGFRTRVIYLAINLIQQMLAAKNIPPQPSASVAVTPV